jgi:hypothetical protein
MKHFILLAALLIPAHSFAGNGSGNVSAALTLGGSVCRMDELPRNYRLRSTHD